MGSSQPADDGGGPAALHPHHLVFVIGDGGTGKTALALALRARHPDRVVLVPEGAPPDGHLAPQTLERVGGALITGGPAKMFVATFLTSAADDGLHLCEQVAGLAGALGAVAHLVVLHNGDADAEADADGASEDPGGAEEEGLGEGVDDGEGEGHGADYGADADGTFGHLAQLGFFDWHALIRVAHHGAAQANPKWGMVYGAGHSDAFFQCLLPHLQSGL